MDEQEEIKPESNQQDWMESPYEKGPSKEEESQEEEPMQAAPPPSRADSAFKQGAAKLKHLNDEIQKVFVGQKNVLRLALTAFLADGHVLIEGYPGLGKTLLVKALSHAVQGDFQRIQFTPDLMPSDVMGHAFYDFKSQSFKIRKGPVFANFLLADEINRAPAKTQSALLEAMQEMQVTIEGTPYKLPQPFMVLATQNPIEQEGTYPLPEAQLDRFLLKINIEYPTAAEELEIVEQSSKGSTQQELNVDELKALLSPEEVVQLRELATQVHVDQQILEYGIEIVRQTREAQGISGGSGPRGDIALLRTARAYAMLQGRNFVVPEDFKSMAIPALAHRIRISPDMEIEGRTNEEMISDLIEKIPVPRS